MTAAMPLFDAEQPSADLILGDCREVMAGMPEASIDAIVCDPPYGLSSGPTKYLGAEGAGAGFMGKAWDHGVPGPDFWREALRVAKPGAHLVAFGGTRTWHRLVCAIEDAGWEIRDSLMWVYGTGFPKSLDISKAIDKAAGAEREVVGKAKPNGDGWGVNGKGAFANAAFGYGQNFDITAPATDLAKRAAGWGTALKPAHEPIVLARKPLVGTVAANFARYGTGGINVDGCRIEGAPSVPGSANITAVSGRALGASLDTTAARRAAAYIANPPTGRWPANVILSEEAACALDEQSGERKSGIAVTRNGGGGTGSTTTMGRMRGFRDNPRPDSGYTDTGGASRFFYCAKASRSERGEGNDWPTVKPIALMRWLCRLVTPPSGIVLDPFHGSGTTLLAARAEGFRSIGIDMDEHAREIAQKRLAR